MAGRDAGRYRLVDLVVASLAVIVPIAVLVWSFARVAPPIFVPSPRVAGAVLPFATADMPTRIGEPPAVARVDAEAEVSVAEVPGDAPTERVVATLSEPSVSVEAASAPPPIAIPAATIVAAPPIVLPIASPTPRAEAWTREASFNFVALGVDRREDGELTRTDTLMVGNFDLVKRRLSVISIPRDLMVEIPGYGKDRINAAYVYGEQFKEPDGGIGLLKRTIEGNFGIPIHHYGLIDFACFRATVDAVGGVTVDVPRTIVDEHYPTDDYGYKTVRFEAGLQWLDGERALEYARTRHADNDFGRIRRQQLVAASLRRELLQMRSLPAVPTILSGCRGMRSDLGWRDYLALATSMRSLRDGEVAFRTIDEGMAVETTLASGAWVLVPRWEPIRALIRESFPTAPRRPTTADIGDVPLSAAPSGNPTSDGLDPTSAAN